MPTMRSRKRWRTVATTLCAVALCAACSNQAAVGFAPTDAGADVTVHGDGATEAAVGGDDVRSIPPDDASAEDSSAIDTGSSTEAGLADAGAADTGVVDAATNDAPNCSVGPSAAYQATCTGCSISATCLLTCTSCKTKAGTQNPNPSLQLPCPGTMSVQNNDGVLTCQ